MLIKKRVLGHDIILDYKRVKSYPHGFTRYRVYKMLGKSKRIFLYTTCLTSFQLNELDKNNYTIIEREVFD